jgi:conserved oligomeric Golgi complex subunit 2
VQELLTSVQKTEDSLRKLKQIRDKNTTSGQSSTTGGQSVSDDDKIRLQIQQDLKHFASEVSVLDFYSKAFCHQQNNLNR